MTRGEPAQHLARVAVRADQRAGRLHPQLAFGGGEGFSLGTGVEHFLLRIEGTEQLVKVAHGRGADAFVRVREVVIG